MSFSAPPRGADYFPFGESNQSHSRWTRWSRRHRVGSTALAPCLARAGANSHILVLKQSRLSRALGIVAAASRQRGSSLIDGHPWPALSARKKTAAIGRRFRLHRRESAADQSTVTGSFSASSVST